MGSLSMPSELEGTLVAELSPMADLGFLLGWCNI